MPHKTKFKQQHRKDKKKYTDHQMSQGQTQEAGSQATISPVKSTYVKPKSNAPVQSIAAVGATRYPYMISEVKWISIFTGIIIIILIALALVLPRFIS
jgi:membrane protein insertase Oxa1/YidC/SpoIIIJ